MHSLRYLLHHLPPLPILPYPNLPTQQYKYSKITKSHAHLSYLHYTKRVCIYIYIYIYTKIHTHTHTHTFPAYPTLNYTTLHYTSGSKINRYQAKCTKIKKSFIGRSKSEQGSNVILFNLFYLPLYLYLYAYTFSNDHDIK